jgi:hypothetical protein
LKKKGVTLRGATDFREERNPPQADNIVSIVPYNITILPYNIAILYHIMRTVLQSTILWQHTKCNKNIVIIKHRWYIFLLTKTNALFLHKTTKRS